MNRVNLRVIPNRMVFSQQQSALFGRVLTTVVASVFLVFALLGPSICMSSEMNAMDCQFTFMGESSTLCQSNSADHVQHWTQLFAAIVPSIVLLIAAACASIVLKYETVLLHDPFKTHFIGYLRGHPDTGRNRSIFSALQKGIIHPVLYA